jgi:hypothetical protein
LGFPGETAGHGGNAGTRVEGQFRAQPASDGRIGAFNHTGE